MSQIKLFRRHLLIIGLLILSSISAISQYATLDNFTGYWSDSNAWTVSNYPGISLNSGDVDCFGYISAFNCLSFNGGILTIHDTLVIHSNLTLDNNETLRILNGGVLIVFGDYLSRNQTEVYNEGSLVVAGEFEMLGADNQGLFSNESNGEVFLFDNTPSIKGGANYSDLSCNDPNNFPADCGYGNQTDLALSALSDFFNSLAYDPDIPYDCDAFSFSTNQTTLCLNEEISFQYLGNSSGDENAYQWNFGEGAVPETASGFGPFVVQYTSAGNKTIQLSDGLVLITKNDYIEVFDLPNINIEDESICGGGEIILTPSNVTGDVVNFSFDRGISIHESVMSPPYSTNVPMSEGESLTIYAQAINTTTNCESGWSESALLTSHINPTLELSDTNVCGAGPITLTAKNVTGHIIYFSKSGSTIFNPILEDPYAIELNISEGEEMVLHALCIDSITGCTNNNRDSALIKTHAIPVVHLRGDSILCEDNIETYYLEEEYTSYLWQDGSILPEYSTSTSELIKVSVIDKNSCFGKDSLQVNYCEEGFNGISKDEADVYTFSPNGDGINDYWIIDNIENFPMAKVYVFNRRGQTVYSCEGDYKNNWNGDSKGHRVPAGSYYFVIDYSFYSLQKTTGIVTILY